MKEKTIELVEKACYACMDTFTPSLENREHAEKVVRDINVKYNSNYQPRYFCSGSCVRDTYL